MKPLSAAAFDVDIETISTVLEAALNGNKVTELVEGDEMKDVLLSMSPENTYALLDITFRTTNNQLLRIGDVVTAELEPGAKEIYRKDQKRIAQVTALINPEYSGPDARKAVLTSLNNLSVPFGTKAKLAGEEVERIKSVNELTWAAILALLLVFMVLAGSFESLLHPLTVLSSIPISLIGVSIVLLPLGQPLGMMSMLGFIILVGVAVNDAILLTQMAKELIQNGTKRKAALAKAASMRLRPIVMTTTTTVLALLPLAIGTGDAAQMRAPLALTVIGGIIASTVGSLVVIPCVYLVLDKAFDIKSNCKTSFETSTNTA